jgi:gas vesicle protein
LEKKFEIELKKDVRLPSNIASAFGKDIIPAGKLITTVRKVIDYLRVTGHKVNDYRDLHDDGIDNDSQPTFTESIKEVFTKGKEVKETVEDVVEDVKEIVEDVKEEKDNILDRIEKLHEKIREELELFYEKYIKPIEIVLANKADLSSVKKEFITPLNKKVNDLTTLSKNSDKVITKNYTEFLKFKSDLTALIESLKPVEIIEETKEVVVDVTPEVTIPETTTTEVKTSLEEQAEVIDITAVDKEKLEEVKKINEEGL